MRPALGPDFLGFEGWHFPKWRDLHEKFSLFHVIATVWGFEHFGKIHKCIQDTFRA